MKIETYVAILIDGRRHQLEVTKKTTCCDVIKIATNDHKSYEIREIRGDIEKVLPRNTKLLKQIRTWGINRQEYSLELKMVADKRKPKMAKLDRARETINRLKSMLKSTDTKIYEKQYEDILNNLDKNSYTDKQYEKNITVIRELNENNTDNMKPVHKGKIDLMNRYLRDIRMADALNTNIDTENEMRVVEDGLEVDVSEATDSDDLDEAFITQSSLTCIEELSNINDDLNECRLYSTVNELYDDDNKNGDTYDDDDDDDDDDESAFEDISDCSSVCELDRNITVENFNNTVIKMNELKAAFSDGDLNRRIVEDSLLNSFMNTVINDGESDEGLSSLDSDIE
ncbi:hypothetical protein ACF0H5_011869 [Mactra antiquata]